MDRVITDYANLIGSPPESDKTHGAAVFFSHPYLCILALARTPDLTRFFLLPIRMYQVEELITQDLPAKLVDRLPRRTGNGHELLDIGIDHLADDDTVHCQRPL